MGGEFTARGVGGVPGGGHGMNCTAGRRTAAALERGTSMPQQDPPRPGAPWREWQEYALTFDGYEYAGSHEALESLYEPVRAAILRGDKPQGDRDTLRAVLFFHQRRQKWIEPWGDDAVAREQVIADAILAALRVAS